MTGSKDQRTGWLKELKVGDYVFVKQYRGTLGSIYRHSSVPINILCFDWIVCKYIRSHRNIWYSFRVYYNGRHT